METMTVITATQALDRVLACNRVSSFFVSPSKIFMIMKNYFMASVAALIVFIFAVLTLTSCTASESLSILNENMQDARASQETIFNLSVSVTQGSIYRGYNGNLKVYSQGERISKMLLTGDRDSTYKMPTDYDYSVDKYVTIHQHVDWKTPAQESYSTVLQLGADGLPTAFVCHDMLSDRILGEGSIDFAFNSSGELSLVHITHGSMVEAYLEYIYADTEESRPALVWTSFYPDALINSITGTKGLGEYIATIAAARSGSHRVKQINVTRLQRDDRYMGEISVDDSESGEGVKLISMHVETVYTYGNPSTWHSKNADSEKWYWLK